MRAIIDSRGLPEAAEYYRMFPREPAQQPQEDMNIDQIDRVSPITLLAVMDHMIQAAGRGETCVLIVAHGEPRGFLMPIAPGGVSAMKDALDVVMKVGTALDRRAQIRQKPPAQQLEAWTDFIEELAPGTIRGTITLQDAERWFERQWLRGQARALRIQPASLDELVGKMKQVRQVALQRVEIRACNIGQDLDALRALREFLGVQRLCAPNVGTFYVRVVPFITSQERRRLVWTRRFAGPAGGRVYAGHTGPQARTFDVIVPAPHHVPLGFLIEEGFTLRVWETSLRPHRYAARATAREWGHVKSWVDQNIMPLSPYRRGNFVLAGMWTFGRGAEPYATPMDPAYRDVIVCSP